VFRERYIFKFYIIYFYKLELFKYFVKNLKVEKNIYFKFIFKYFLASLHFLSHLEQKNLMANFSQKHKKICEIFGGPNLKKYLRHLSKSLDNSTSWSIWNFV